MTQTLTPMTGVPAAYLRQAAQTPAIRAIKHRAYTLLGLLPGAQVLDIGCGPGISTPDLARLVGPYGRVCGIDHDPAMVQEADAAARFAGVSAWTTHRQADAAALPFPPASFDAVFSDRVLQHLPPPKARACVAEAVRVTRPGGAVVFVDSDWGSFSVDSTEPETERQVQTLHLSRTNNPFAGRSLGRLLTQAGLGFVGVEPVAVPLTAAQAANLLAGTERQAASQGLLTPEEQARWRDGLAAWSAGADVVGHLTIVIAAGRRG
jgi:ubiquinone/menaquinone biosynthesis C-methylase UbiE